MLLAVPAALSLGLIVDASWLFGLLFLDACIIALIAIDGLMAWRSPQALRVDLSHAGTWSQSRPETVTVALDHLGSIARTIRLIPDLPASMTADDAPRSVRVPGRMRAELAFTVRASERGTFVLRGVHVELLSRCGLWRRIAHLPRPPCDGAKPAGTVHVYPNLKQLSEYALLARTERLNLIGVRRTRRVGGDTEFERLRDRVSDDPLNRMDWRATARRDVLTVRDYQTNQSQSVILLVDAGRMMVTSLAAADPRSAASSGGRSLLDASIDAALMLAYVATRQGDRVGLIAYADGVKRTVSARGGPRQVSTLIHALHDVQASRVESRHEDAFLHLERHERKRSLVCVLTHLLDEVNAGHLERHARLLSGRHLPVIVLLRDPDLHRMVPDPGDVPADDDAFWRAGAAATIVTWRQGVIDRLKRAGALVIDSDPDALTAEVISRYLDIKARHLL